MSLVTVVEWPLALSGRGSHDGTVRIWTLALGKFLYVPWCGVVCGSSLVAQR